MEKLTYASWVEMNIDFLIDDQSKGALNVLRWAYDEYNDELVYACSFGVEGIVMLDLISQMKPTAKVVFLDTELHFQETYALIDEVKQRYPQLVIEMKKPALTVEEQAEKYGDKLWERQPNRCCYMRKVVPLREALGDATAWLSGLRREQSPSRSQTNFINKDETFESIKICPLIHWTWTDIWNYVEKYQLPYNPLHDQGFPSIGCVPCTFPGDTATGSREGRWANQTKTECGLHEN
ncbi:phosphoadenylyl-sulfate reductase [Sporosarcina limicola]|uniref:Adenosine 5'-phosphosulfate reductase n=1 Tax=Sporosarcina limicola TaxID=34101 RepID=A0A927R5I7_9BACL|nr:phosphoadenylyl-sulfate reductase [Sporosarcina limicola]MBE1553949.1 phosphoadenosine phosphosulfate reductase [Sporosarcina limicola]